MMYSPLGIFSFFLLKKRKKIERGFPKYPIQAKNPPSFSENDTPPSPEMNTATDLSDPSPSPATSTKRSVPVIRKEMLELGCHFFRFAPPPSGTPKQAADKWRTMEEKGFLVSKDGCIFPYGYYRETEKGGDKFKGHQRSSYFFHGRRPDPTRRFNEHGWPCHEEVSHLCHRADCVRPDHLVVEEFWRNRKRNFCGFAGACDCGNRVRCLRTYRDPGRSKEAIAAARDASEAAELLAPLLERHPFRLLPRTHYAAEDGKRENRGKRKRKHCKQVRMAERRARKKDLATKKRKTKEKTSSSSSSSSEPHVNE